jgi:ABC-2 type transport system ATP-binding protein
MIKVRNLYKSFGNQKVMDNLDLNVKKASVYGLVGPNGAGKTTLIKHLAGIYRADRGSAMVCGESVFNNAVPKMNLFYIPDELYFFSQYSIEDTARFYAGIYPSWNWERYNLLKEAFRIDTKRRIVKLSKGMQKQVAFWLGISTMPQLMLMDEPADGLDPVMRRQVWNLMLQDVAEREMTVLISSHNLRELEDVCDSIGILHDGRIIVEKELDDLKLNIHKLQVAFSGDTYGDVAGELFHNFEILNHHENGSIHLYIIRGEKEKILAEVRRKNPTILDMLPLSLEEIFIYELGVIGYEVKNILI